MRISKWGRDLTPRLAQWRIWEILAWRAIFCASLLLMARTSNSHADSKRTEKSVNSSQGNLSAAAVPPDLANEGSIADMFDRVLEKEFAEKEQPEGSDSNSFNNSVADQQAVLETVARVTHDKPKKNESKEENGTRSFQLQDVFSLDNENGADDMPTLIDRKDNVFVMSNPKSKYPILKLDVRFIFDLVVVIVSAAIGGIVFACLGQPVITGYLLAGSIIGPGGLSFVSEMVQCSDKLGLSLELGSFAAGVMISTTDFAHHTLEQVEPIRNLFAALFLSSIGMLIHVQFLWNHMDILLASVILVIIAKTVVVTVVVKGFGYSIRTAFFVGMSLAQIGEFAFVLLSRASNLHLIEGKLYLLLLGTTALSLVTTPLLFRMIPVIMHLGVLMGWFPPDSNQTEVLSKERD